MASTVKTLTNKQDIFSFIFLSSYFLYHYVAPSKKRVAVFLYFIISSVTKKDVLTGIILIRIILIFIINNK